MKFVAVPYSRGSLGKNEGCEKAPLFLLSHYPHVRVSIDPAHFDSTMEQISRADGDFFVGGDHSITYGSFKGFAQKFKNPGILIFDAHPDLEEYTESVTHEDYLRKLIEEKIVKKHNVILIGVRAVSDNERTYMAGMQVYSMDVLFRNEESVCDMIMEYARSFDGLYVSIDIDVLDPAFAPGTGYLEPGGMDLPQLLYFLKRITHLTNLRRIDLVEINPEKDVHEMTINAGKKIIEIFT